MATCSTDNGTTATTSSICHPSNYCPSQKEGSKERLPKTVHLPDGEELYRGRPDPREGRPARDSPPLSYDLSQLHELSRSLPAQTSGCVVAPPNRTLLPPDMDARLLPEPLPFSPASSSSAPVLGRTSTRSTTAASLPSHQTSSDSKSSNPLSLASFLSSAASSGRPPPSPPSASQRRYSLSRRLF